MINGIQLDMGGQVVVLLVVGAALLVALICVGAAVEAWSKHHV